MDKLWFPLPPAKTPELMSPIALAFIGDAIFDLYMRQYVLSQDNHRPEHLHRAKTQFVTATAQARTLARWLPMLSEEELAVVKRGRNAKSGRAPRNANVLEYRQSTALECLLGYLYYKGQHDRLTALLHEVISEAKGM